MSIDTNKAWDKLHTRLADEQLLSRDDVKTGALPLIAKMRRVAAIVVLCICCGAAVLLFFPDKETEQLFTLHNNETSNTLVSTLNDGSIVYLTDGATLTYPKRFDSDKRQVTLQGEALFDIRGDKDCPFLIETESTVVEVLGTAFSIKSGGRESFELSVQHGLVKATLKATNAQALVEAGETVRLNDNHQLLKEISGNQRQFAQYTEKMRFKDERLDRVIHVINKISDKPVIFADSLSVGMEINVTFDNNTPTDMIELICQGFNLTHTVDGEHIVIASPPAP